MAFRSFVQKIKVLDDHAILTYTVPINGLMEEKIGVLPIVQYQWFEAKMVGHRVQ